MNNVFASECSQRKCRTNIKVQEQFYGTGADILNKLNNRMACFK